MKSLLTTFDDMSHRRPAVVTAAIVCLGGIFAVALQGAFLMAPSLDVVDSYVVGPAWLLGTTKHPGLPVWLLEVSRLMTGAVGWPAYALGRLTVVAGFFFVYLLGRDTVGPYRAATAVLALTAVEYFSWRSFNYNHNLAQLPFWAACAWLAWRAVERDRNTWWIALGVTAALGLYTKLSFALLLLVIAIWLLADRKARARLSERGPWLGLAAFAVAVTPLASWLSDTGLSIIDHAKSRLVVEADVAQFWSLLGLVGAVSTVGGMLLLALGGSWRSGKTRQPALAERHSDWRAAAFLWLVGSGPFAITLLVTMTSNSRVVASWLMPNLVLLPLQLIALAPAMFDRMEFRRVAIAGSILALLIPVVHTGSVFAITKSANGKVSRSSWPQEIVAQRIRAAWDAEVQTPLQIVSGPQWLAGAIALDGKHMAYVIPYGDRTQAPWVTDAAIARHGVLLVWDSSRTAPDASPELAPFARVAADLPVRKAQFSWPRTPYERPLIVSYVIIPPKVQAASRSTPVN